jgi:hypothetical protein
MKTSIVHKWNSEALRRGRLPSEVVPEDPAGRIAHFSPSRTEEYQTFDPGTLKVGPKKKRRLPDAVTIGSHRFFLERGRTEDAVVIPPDYVADLDALDEQIKKLERERRELIEEAFRHGRPLRKADIVSEEKAGLP